MNGPLVEARRLGKRYPADRRWWGASRRWLLAVEQVDLAIGEAEIVALVGESGSGKTTLGRLLVRLTEPTAGEVRFDGIELGRLAPRALRRARRQFQIVFQDPYGALDPRMRIRSVLEEPLLVHQIGDRSERRERVDEMLDRVGLGGLGGRWPHELSGGQRQRVAIARALMTEPRFLVADEPVAALDVSVQAQILNLLARLQSQLGLAMLFIAHDLAVVEHLADRVAVMYRGRIVELAPCRELFARPRHPYTNALLAAARGGGLP